MKVIIPTPLRQYAGKQASVELPAGTVGEALSGLVERNPELRKHLFTEDGKLRAFVNVYVNDEDIRYLEQGKYPAGRERHDFHRALHRRRLLANPFAQR